MIMNKILNVMILNITWDTQNISNSIFEELINKKRLHKRSCLNYLLSALHLLPCLYLDPFGRDRIWSRRLRGRDQSTGLSSRWWSPAQLLQHARKGGISILIGQSMGRFNCGLVLSVLPTSGEKSWKREGVEKDKRNKICRWKTRQR